MFVIKKRLKILVVDDDEGILKSLAFTLGQEFEHVTTLRYPGQIPFLMQTEYFDLVLLDMNFRAGQNIGNEGIFWLKEILKIRNNTVVIMITAFGSIHLAVKAIKEGASDFITKPWKTIDLIRTITEALAIKSQKAGSSKVQVGRKDPTPAFIGKSANIENLLAMAKKAAQSDATLLITGDHGTGKEVLARQIHAWPNRHTKPFVAVDLGAITPSLFESELFGHAKGAYTGANEERQGWFELTNGGTLFLDEIGNLQVDQQQKLLTVLQRNEVTRVGSDRTVTVDNRIIIATNENLQEKIREGNFRSDLFYRINTIQIHIPPLRLRKPDIKLLTRHFLLEFSARYQRPASDITADAMQKLENYHWPGNVRELQHIIEKAVILHDSPVVTVDQISFSEAEISFTTDSLNLEEVEKNTIMTALIQTPGNLSQVARELGISRKTLYKKIEKYGL
nr:sigma-54-dependent Fis family transcriptional regulator [Bacteroidota bacterium]